MKNNIKEEEPNSPAEELKQCRYELKERIKELNCIYGIIDIIEKEEPLEKMIREIVNILPSSWRYTEITCARVILEGCEYKTLNFKETIYSQSADIFVFGEKKGILQVCYLEKMPDSDAGPFLNTERILINAIAQLLGKIIQRKKAEEDLKKSHNELRKLFEKLQTIREEERKSIAGEIHDELGQVLTALKIDINWLRKKLPEEKSSLVKKTLEMEELVDMTIQNVKRIAAELRPVLLDDFGLTAAILWQVKEFKKRSGIKCDISFNMKDTVPGKEKATVIYRIVQELLTNIIRHAEATLVEIKLYKMENKLVLEVMDDGKGIQENQAFSLNSFGLQGVRERVRYWGGKVSINSTPDKGTAVTVHFPIEN